MFKIKIILIFFALNILFISCGLWNNENYDDDECIDWEWRCHLNSGNPDNFTILNSKLIFFVNTSRIIEIDESATMKELTYLHYIYDNLVLNNFLYFVQGNDQGMNLFRYDGKNSIQKIFHEEREGINARHILLPYKDKIFIANSYQFHDDSGYSESTNFYLYDRINPPVFVKKIDTGIKFSDYNLYNIVYKDKLYFTLDNKNSYGNELWCYDENSNEIFKIQGLREIRKFVIFQDKLYLSASDYNYGHQLWVIDGEKQPVMLTNQEETGIRFIYPIAVYNEKLLCSGQGLLYEYDGTNSIYPLPVNNLYPYYPFNEVLDFKIFNNHFYFIANSKETGDNYLWDYDGISALVKINTDQNVQQILYNNGKLMLIGYGIYFFDGINNPELYYISEMNLYLRADFQNNYYVTGYSNVYGNELWKIDNTGVCKLVKDFVPGETCGYECVDKK